MSSRGGAYTYQCEGRVLLYYLCSSILWPTSQHPRGIGYIGGRDGLPRRLTVCRSRMDVCLPLLIRWGCFSRQQFHEVVGVSRVGKDRHPGRERRRHAHTERGDSEANGEFWTLDRLRWMVGWPFLTLRYSCCFVVIILVE